jgi:Uri superfamily endonuclease
VGRLGGFAVPTGWYVYAGSALGGLPARVMRHLRGGETRHWHIDYLRAEATIRADYCVPGRERRECELAAALRRLPEAALPVARFGASDCRCLAHLVHLPYRPDLTAHSEPAGWARISSSERSAT